MTPSRSRSPRSLRFGTRGSALALAQTNAVVDRLDRQLAGRMCEVVIIQTEGDLDRISPLNEIGGRGAFTNAIERAILNGQVNAAVHSAKDLPTALHPDAPIVAFPGRDDPRDALVSRHQTTLDRLPANPLIGTSSRRRAVQILCLRPDARIVNIRGNIDTRLRKSEGVDFDAIVLAAAGLNRMGWSARASEIFPIERLVPSPGQGAIAVQARRDTEAAHLLATIDDVQVSEPVEIERAFLAAIGAGCATPVGANASSDNGVYRLVAMLAAESGEHIAYTNELLTTGDERQHAAEIARRLKAQVTASGENHAWAGWQQGERDLAGTRVVVTRPRRQAGQLLATLADRGARALSLPTIRIEPVTDTRALDAALRDLALGEFAWLAFTSANAVDIVRARLASLGIEPSRLTTAKVAVVGRATAQAATDAGLQVSLVPRVSTGEGLASEMRGAIQPGERILYPRSAIGQDALTERLRESGHDVVAIDAYQIIPEQDVDPFVLDLVRTGDVDAIAFASPSSVQNLLALIEDSPYVLERIPAFCAGPVTADAARAAGLLVAGVSADPGAAAMADAIAAHLCCRGDVATVQGDSPLAAPDDLVKGRSE